MNDFNQRVIAEFRANHGRVVRAAGFGSSLVVLHTVGARSGEERINPALARRDGDDWLIAASAAGARQHPAWFVNLRAHPDTTIETGAGTVAVTAEELAGEEYADAWRGFVAQSPAFAAYQECADRRRIPVVRLRRRNSPGRLPR
ncbi:nitroreductase/quinone reductase family protein [Cryptosporangium minutisporangium]|uniref:Nitroreductase family deazaflavin-dependent oxidoreductase n=1 Tax=Cryptosporangium minutisporangium TaxID=113569 RepID=A0ABP6SSW0_9ACTN